MEANHPHLTTAKAFYVEISRARDRAELVSDEAVDRLDECRMTVRQSGRWRLAETVLGGGGERARSNEFTSRQPVSRCCSFDQFPFGMGRRS